MDSSELTARDGFEYWLASIDDYIQEFREQFSESERKCLDFSASSLDAAEAWILANFGDVDAMISPQESRRVNLVACYIGETFRKTRGGHWDIRLDDPRFAFHALPILTGIGAPKCPLTLATAAADRRTGKYLRTVLMNSGVEKVPGTNEESGFGVDS